MKTYKVEHYLTAVDHRSPFLEWLKALRDAPSKIAVVRRIARLELGNFGDHKFCRDGVWELRIDVGPGLRVYYGMSGASVILLMTGGSKRTQQSDIGRAVTFWRDWNGRASDEKQIQR